MEFVLPPATAVFGFASSFAICASISFCHLARSAAIRLHRHGAVHSSLGDDSCRTICCSSEACLWTLNNQDGILYLHVLQFLLVQSFDVLHTVQNNSFFPLMANCCARLFARIETFVLLRQATISIFMKTNPASVCAHTHETRMSTHREKNHRDRRHTQSETHPTKRAQTAQSLVDSTRGTCLTLHWIVAERVRTLLHAMSSTSSGAQIC